MNRQIESMLVDPIRLRNELSRRGLCIKLDPLSATFSDLRRLRTEIESLRQESNRLTRYLHNSKDEQIIFQLRSLCQEIKSRRAREAELQAAVPKALPPWLDHEVPEGSAPEDDTPLSFCGQPKFQLPGPALARIDGNKSLVVSSVRRATNELADSLLIHGLSEQFTTETISGNRNTLTNRLVRDEELIRSWLGARRQEHLTTEALMLLMPSSEPRCGYTIPSLGILWAGSTPEARTRRETLISALCRLVEGRKIGYRTWLACSQETTRDASCTIKIEVWVPCVQRYLCLATVTEHSDYYSDWKALVGVLDLDLSLIAESIVENYAEGDGL